MATDLMGRGAATPAVAVEVASPVSTILATSPNGQYERVPTIPTVIRLKPRGAPLSTVADAKANPPGGKSWLSPGNLSSSVQTAAAQLTMVANVASARQWNDSAQDAPALVASYPMGSAREIVCRVSSASTAVDIRAMGIVAYTGATSTYAQVALAYGVTSGQYTVFSLGNGTGATQSANLTVDEWNNGVWLRLRWQGAVVYAEYNTANQATAPTSWTALGNYSLGNTNNRISVARFLEHLTDTSTAFTAKFLYLDDTGMAESPYCPDAVAYPQTGMGYATTPDGITLLSCDFGSPVTPDQAAVRAMLADAINTLPGDAGAWTFSVVGGVSANPAASTYQVAASVTVSGPFRYWAIYAKCTSTAGAQAGSIDTALVSLSASP